MGKYYVKLFNYAKWWLGHTFSIEFGRVDLILDQLHHLGRMETSVTSNVDVDNRLKIDWLIWQKEWSQVTRSFHLEVN